MTGERVNVPPCGHVAGVYARVDVSRGVHKAPANELVMGAGNLVRHITPEEQAELNSNGVNCIRYFPNRGIRIWGARTLAEAESEWRYVNVRRLFNYVEESIGLGTGWTVFEPNDPTLWGNIRRDVGHFLMRLWRDGALMGRSPEEAFYVQCDEQTNPPENIDAGQVVALIGLAPVKPAEFIIFRIGQHEGGTEVEEVTHG
jgi:phage tail sheath protein FI